MRAAQVLVVSAIAHAPLVVYVAQLATPTRPRPRAPIATSRVPAPPAAVEPIEVAFLVAEPAAGASGKRVTTTAAPREIARVTTGSSAGGQTQDPPEPGKGTGRGTGTATMRMRGLGANLGLDPGTAERIAAAGGGDPPDELRRSGKLKPQPGGRAVVHDRVTTMTVDADGKAHFDDAKDIDLRFKLPIPKLWEVDRMRRELGHELTEWFKDPEAGKRFGTTSELPRHLQASEGACDAWGSTMCDDPLAPRIEQLVRERKKVTGGFFGGPMSITDWLHRKYVGDPYASRKLKLLADTLDERVAMGEAHRAKQRTRSAELMRNNLERLWAREHDPVARRAALFELWDECDEDETGGRARAVVIGWIRARLPAGSPDGYSDEELRMLQDHRTSRAVFAPYAE